jgi:hypothetical protein
MSAARESTLIAVQDVRKDAALVVELCDAAVYGVRFEREQALRQLPQALRRLAVTMPRALAALEAEGIR